VRQHSLNGLEFMASSSTRRANAAMIGKEGEISTRVAGQGDGGPTNEEKTIARDVARVLGGVMPTFTPPESFS